MDSDENFDLPESSVLTDTNVQLPAIQSSDLISTIRSSDIKSLFKTNNTLQIESLDQVRVSIIQQQPLVFPNLS